jgi:hypothetical protein
VFGESVLNDAVAMVLYETLSGFVGQEVTAGKVLAGKPGPGWVFQGQGAGQTFVHSPVQLSLVHGICGPCHGLSGPRRADTCKQRKYG